MVDLNITLPAGFLEEEVRCGYTVSKQMKEVWAVELDLLNRFLQACDKYGLKCYADAGTLMGAARHKGFIPWDDDIDLVMFRGDYNRMIEIAKGGEFEAPYFFQTVYTDKGYPRGHAQFRNSQTTGILKSEYELKRPFNQGIFIDVFVLDGVPSSQFMLSITRRLHWLLRGKKFFYHCSWPLFKFCFWLQELCLRLNSVSRCKKVAPLGFIFETEKRIRDKSIYDETMYLPFESLSIPVPYRYDEFLTHRFGDWKTPCHVPTTHGGCIFDAGKVYTEYLFEK